jgi:membrane protein DedA with SNARE-associated domain
MFNIASLIEQSPYLVIFALLLLGDIGLPFPEDTTLILSGFLISQGITKLLPTFLVVYSGLLITDFSLYLAGRKYGRRIVEHKRFHKIISAERLSKLEEKFKRWGIFVVFFGRHLLGVRAQIFLVAGVMRMPAIRFLMADAASAIITITLMVGIGYLGGNSIETLKKDITRVEHIVVLLMITLFVGWIIFRYFKSLKKLKDRP